MKIIPGDFYCMVNGKRYDCLEIQQSEHYINDALAHPNRYLFTGEYHAHEWRPPFLLEGYKNDGSPANCLRVTYATIISANWRGFVMELAGVMGGGLSENGR